MDYSLFLDESGDHDLSFVDKNFPIFLLCGCLIEHNALKAIEERIATFKEKYFQTTEVVLHSRDIRKCQGAFQILFDLQLKEQFYSDLDLILSESSYFLLGSGIDKKKLIQKYGKGAKDPYALSLSFIIERLIFCLEASDKNASVKILAEERGKREDQMLLSHFNSILDRGTFYISPGRLRQKINGLGFHSKYDNVTGLQIADLCAYPMARHLLHPKEPYIPFKVVEQKIYVNKKGKYMGWGLKIFP